MTVKVHRPPSLKDAYFNMIVFGRTGAGKTHLVATMQECKLTSPTLAINFNGGMITVSAGVAEHPEWGNLKIADPIGFDDLQEIYDGLWEGQNKWRKYKGVALDTLTDEQNDISLNSLMDEVDETGKFINLSKTDVEDRIDWRRSGKQMRRLIRAFRNLSYHPDPALRRHVLMTAHQRRDESTEVVCPNISGVVGVEAGGYVDVLGNLERRVVLHDGKRRVRRYLHTEEHERDGVTYLGKTRLPALGRGVWDPTMQKLVDLWRSQQNER